MVIYVFLNAVFHASMCVYTRNAKISEKLNIQNKINIKLNLKIND